MWQTTWKFSDLLAEIEQKKEKKIRYFVFCDYSLFDDRFKLAT